jgi:hypothetical protein
MADRICRPCRALARRQLRLLNELNQAPSTFQRASIADITRSPKRQFHQTVPSRQQNAPQPQKPAGLGRILVAVLSNLLPNKAIQPYQIFGATESIYKACAAPVAYKISPELRKKEEVPMTEDGEEIGIGGGVWHDGTYDHTGCEKPFLACLTLTNGMHHRVWSPTHLQHMVASHHAAHVPHCRTAAMS